MSQHELINLRKKYRTNLEYHKNEKYTKKMMNYYDEVTKLQRVQHYIKNNMEKEELRKQIDWINMNSPKSSKKKLGQSSSPFKGSSPFKS